MDSSDPGYGPVETSCELRNELSGYIKCYEFLDWLSGCQLLKKDFVPCRLLLSNDQ
jgi:hypothetical protein